MERKAHSNPGFKLSFVGHLFIYSGELLERGCHDYTSIPGGKGIAWNNN
jgi:hypothetical protein